MYAGPQVRIREMGDEVYWTRAEASEFDRWAIEELGVPRLVLMENAGRGASDWICTHRRELDLGTGARIGILCGRGNNGGDGYALARHLKNSGFEVHIFELGDGAGLGDEAAIYRGVCAQMALPMADLEVAVVTNSTLPEMDLWVDGLLGTGFHPPLREPLRVILAWLAVLTTRSGKAVIALDGPSGIDSDTGKLGSAHIRARHTLCFGARKAGFKALNVHSEVGEVHLIGLGVPVPRAAGPYS
jgi:NAD(P)H-hydrate epimerase